MFYYLDGTFAHRGPQFAVVDCGGVGYRVYTSLHTLSSLGEVGSRVKVYTHLYIREEIMDLYGFCDLEELNCFKMLLAVSGVGPKAALSVLSLLSPGQFAVCVVTQDAKSLTRAPGIGTKMAQRILLELKDKISNEQLASKGALQPALTLPASGKAEEALNALMVLGYTRGEGQQAIARIQTEELTLEEIIKEALKKLMR